MAQLCRRRGDWRSPTVTVAVRRGRIDAGFRRGALGDLEVLGITTDQHTDWTAWSETLDLVDRFRLAVCDAAYLELAQRRGLPFATLNDELGAAFGLRLLGKD
jgi:predicted nucleic acid-binding protein